ncbi:ribonucleotide-diphosphate reductase subunit alpha [Clostridia bacterium]|nr:ribonucleotide-diphosphate reductase subunit alpha [Clostridia bacterium]
MAWTENAQRVLSKRYLAKDENGVVTENIEQMFHRVADTVAGGDRLYGESVGGSDRESVGESVSIEQTASRFYQMMTDQEFMPNSPTLMNAGRPLGQLSACFVLPVPDSLSGIFDAVKNAALIHQSGGGTGFSFSRLRPQGASVRTSGGVASGPISFMKVFNTATEAIKQGGVRRGANMGILRVDHPDILSFITCKRNTSEITNFNISVGLTEAFMSAAEADLEYALINPADGRETGRLKAREVLDLIVQSAWETGEPGIVFLDRINRDNVIPEIEIEATNPCGEQPLLPYESCNLGSINLGKMVRASSVLHNATMDKTNKTDKTSKADKTNQAGKAEIDWGRLDAAVADAVHFLDNVITINKYPLPEIKEQTEGTRKIGLGVMGWADMLFQLMIPYNSDEAVRLAETIMKRITDKARAVSVKLAKLRGPFPFIERSVFKNDPNPPRNGTVTTIAPTGTISILCNASSGIEPLFALAFARNVMDHDTLVEAHPYFEQVARERGFYSPELMREVAAKGTLHGVNGVPEDIRRVFVTAHDISPEAHIRMQAAFQKHIDNAVSKTVNFTREATKDDVRTVYELAWKLGCKGITIYRDGSRDEQVLTVGSQSSAQTSTETDRKSDVNEQGSVKIDQESKATDRWSDGLPPMLCDSCEIQEPPHFVTPRSRKDVTSGITEKVRIGCGNLYVTVNYDEQGICEVFTNLGRAGGCPSQSEATSRLVSMALRAGVDPEVMIEQLRGIRCHSTLRQPGLKVLSCPDAIGRVLEKVLHLQRSSKLALPTADSDGRENDSAASTLGCISNCSLCGHPQDCVKKSKNGCPECGGKLEREGGCVICRGCGYSKCN